MFAKTPLISAALAFSILAPAPAIAHAQSRARADGRTFAADSFWVRKWFRGGSKEEDLLTEPRQIITTRGTVVVLDERTREVLGFDAGTGRNRLLLKASGEGPGEFRQPRWIGPTQSGFVVLDIATARLTAFDSLGGMQWDAPMKSGTVIEGVCVLRSGQLWSKVGGAIGSLIRSDTTSRILARVSLDARADSNAGFGWSGFVAGPDAADNCVIARRYGTEWFVVAPSGIVARHSYIERMTEPAVDVIVKPGKKDGKLQNFQVTQKVESNASAADAMLRGDTLIVRAGGATRDKFALLDYYSVSTGRYLHSRRLPFIPNALTVGADGVFYATSIANESAAVLALTTTATKPVPKAPPRKPQSGK